MKSTCLLRLSAKVVNVVLPKRGILAANASYNVEANTRPRGEPYACHTKFQSVLFQQLFCRSDECAANVLYDRCSNRHDAMFISCKRGFSICNRRWCAHVIKSLFNRHDSPSVTLFAQVKMLIVKITR